MNILKVGFLSTSFRQQQQAESLKPLISCKFLETMHHARGQLQAAFRGLDAPLGRDGGLESAVLGEDAPESGRGTNASGYSSKKILLS